MATQVKIFTYPNNINVKKALIAAKFGNVEITYDDSFQMGVTNKTPEFLKMNPFGKVPAAMTPEGPLFESTVIARYVARKADKNLLGTNDYESSVIEQYVAAIENELVTPGFKLLAHIFNYMKIQSSEAYAAEEAKITKAVTAIESCLGSHKFIVSDNITFADIVVSHALTMIFNAAFGKSYVAGFPKIQKYLQDVLALPQFQGILELTLKDANFQFA